MSSGKPIIRQVAWVSVIPRFILVMALLLILSIYVYPFELAVIIALMAYIGISMLMRQFVPCNHRKGIMLYKKGDYAQAIKEYKKSYDFFCRHPWVDKYRYITLLSTNRISYTEMALANIAFCYAQSGNGELSKQYYNKVLELFPGSELAKSALNMISLFDKKPEPES